MLMAIMPQECVGGRHLLVKKFFICLDYFTYSSCAVGQFQKCGSNIIFTFREKELQVSNTFWILALLQPEKSGICSFSARNRGIANHLIGIYLSRSLDLTITLGRSSSCDLHFIHYHLNILAKAIEDTENVSPSSFT